MLLFLWFLFTGIWQCYYIFLFCISKHDGKDIHILVCTALILIDKLLWTLCHDCKRLADWDFKWSWSQVVWYMSAVRVADLWMVKKACWAFLWWPTVCACVRASERVLSCTAEHQEHYNTTVFCLQEIRTISITGKCIICPAKLDNFLCMFSSSDPLVFSTSSTWWAPLFNLKVMRSRAPLWTYEKLSRERSASLIPPHGFSVLSVRS